MQVAKLVATLPIGKLKAKPDCKKDWTDIFHTDDRFIAYTDKNVINVVRYGKDKYYMHSIVNSHDNGTFTLAGITDKLDTVNIEVIKIYRGGVSTTYMRRSK